MRRIYALVKLAKKLAGLGGVRSTLPGDFVKVCIGYCGGSWRAATLRGSRDIDSRVSDFLHLILVNYVNWDMT